ncbi:SpoIID/LytB domain-containing protein [Candidatus Riflebacteria bacterium]
MRKPFFLFYFPLVTIFLQNYTLYAAQIPRLRVHLGDLQKVELNFPAGGKVFSNLSKGPIKRLYKKKSLALRVNKGFIKISHQKKKQTLYFKGNNGELSMNGRLFEGIIKIKVQNKKLRVINVINLESYLLGVVGNEMSASWPMEALKAQAVLARTYALKKLKTRAHQTDKDFDLCNNIHCQVYGGKSKSIKILDSVRKTLGQVVVDKSNKLINAFYSASCGGKTASNNHVWGGKILPYLVTKVDPYCVQSDRIYWKRTYPYLDVIKKLQKKYPLIRNTRKIKVKYSRKTGRVESVTFSHPQQSYEIDGVALRQIMNVRKFPSNIFKVVLKAGKVSEPELFAVSLPGSHSKWAISKKQLQKKKYYIKDFISEKRGRKSKVAGAVTVRAPLTYLKKTIKKLNQQVDNLNDTLVFLGRGYGHGVGMCQWGSRIQAELSRSYREIIEFYFKGVSIKNLYQPGRSLRHP